MISHAGRGGKEEELVLPKMSGCSTTKNKSVVIIKNNYFIANFFK